LCKLAGNAQRRVDAQASAPPQLEPSLEDLSDISKAVPTLTRPDDWHLRCGSEQFAFRFTKVSRLGAATTALEIRVHCQR